MFARSGKYPNCNFVFFYWKKVTKKKVKPFPQTTEKYRENLGQSIFTYDTTICYYF